MKKQVSSFLMPLLVVAGIFTFIAVTLISAYVSANNYAAATEANLRAARDDNKNILGQYQQKILEAAQVPEMYKNDLKEVVSAAVQGRYGSDGSRAVMQWIQEANIPFDSSLYTKLTEIIQAGRKDFEIGQRKMIDIRRDYETQLGYAWKGFWLRTAGFPKLKLEDFNPITTDRVETTYQNGKESAPLKLR